MLLCGLLYPCLLTGLAAFLFPRQAGGSLIAFGGHPVGSEYVGQEFTEDCYLWGRPSACHYNVFTEGEDGSRHYSDGTPFPGISSGSDNDAPSSPALQERVETDRKTFLEKNPDYNRKTYAGKAAGCFR